MSDGGDWLSTRRPEPPEGLARRLDRIEVERSASRSMSLAGAAREELDAARNAPGRVRESALRLLTADALFTYASEAALEEADPAAALEALVRKAGGVEP